MSICLFDGWRGKKTQNVFYKKIVFFNLFRVQLWSRACVTASKLTISDLLYLTKSFYSLNFSVVPYSPTLFPFYIHDHREALSMINDLLLSVIHSHERPEIYQAFFFPHMQNATANFQDLHNINSDRK